MTAPGRSHDSRVFEDSNLKNQHDQHPLFYNNSAVINNVHVPMLLLGDGAYRLKSYLMKPYPYQVKKTRGQALFNYHLSRTRRLIENSFGHLIGRFRILSKSKYNNILFFIYRKIVRLVQC